MRDKAVPVSCRDIRLRCRYAMLEERKRPDPDVLLAHVQANDLRQARGRLKIFLGYAAGVGKT
jgi:hypothetical protein